MFGLFGKKSQDHLDNFLFRHDLVAIHSEVKFLLEHYGDDYAQLAVMCEIAQTLVNLSDLNAIKNACGILYSKVALIQQYDVEFKVASLDLLVKLDNVRYCEYIEQ